MEPTIYVLWTCTGFVLAVGMTTIIAGTRLIIGKMGGNSQIVPCFTKCEKCSTGTNGQKELSGVQNQPTSRPEDVSRVPRSLHPAFSPNSPAYPGTAEEIERPTVRQRVSGTRSPDPETVRDVWEREIPEASPRLLEAAYGGLALPTMSPETPRGYECPQGHTISHLAKILGTQFDDPSDPNQITLSVDCPTCNRIVHVHPN